MACKHCHVNHQEHNHHKEHDHSHHHHDHEHAHGSSSLVLNITKIVVAVIFVIISYSLNFFYKGIDSNIPLRISLIIISALVYVFLAYDLFFSAIKSICKGKVFTESFLMLIATVGAFAIQAYEEAILVLVFNLIGEMLEDYATEKSKKGIANLINNINPIAHKLDNNETIDIDPKTLKVNDLIKVYEGEKIPVDGEVVDGDSSLDLSSLTGESLPRDVKTSDKVYSGAVNLSNSLTIKVEKEYKNSTLQQVLQLVESEESKKSNSENFITKFSAVYTPIVIVIAILYFIIPLGIRNWDWANYGVDYLRGALNLLLISCPCALVISIPLSFFAGLGKASKLGALVKGSYNLERFAKSKTIVFDKTGTLTKGSFELVSNNSNENIKIAASLEKESNHPIARSIVIKNKDNDFYSVTSLENIKSQGVRGIIEGIEYFIGSRKYIEEQNIIVENIESNSKYLYLANLTDKKLLDKFILEDTIKETSKEAVERLYNSGINNTLILSGDNKQIVSKIQNDCDIIESYGELLPQDKLNKIKELQNSKEIVTFVGDGVNDAPSLLASDVGIAMGGLGSDSAKESASIVVLNDDINTVASVKQLSKFTMNLVYENIAIILLVKFIVIILTLPIPSFNFHNNDWWMIVSIASDVGIMLIAVLNSLRSLLFKPNFKKVTKK